MCTLTLGWGCPSLAQLPVREGTVLALLRRALALSCADSTTCVAIAEMPQLCAWAEESPSPWVFLKNLNIREELSKVWR